MLVSEFAEYLDRPSYDKYRLVFHDMMGWEDNMVPFNFVEETPHVRQVWFLSQQTSGKPVTYSKQKLIDTFIKGKDPNDKIIFCFEEYDNIYIRDKEILEDTVILNFCS